MLKRIGAIILAVLLIGMYVVTFVMGITGYGNVMGMIFLDVVIPIICWGVWLIARVLKRKGEDIRSAYNSNYKDVEKKDII